MQDLVDTRQDAQSAASPPRWGLFAAFGSYLLICTVQQGLHLGLGHGQRRIGKRRRMAVRTGFVGASIAIAVALGARWLAFSRWWTLGYAVGATLLAAIELFGRQKRTVNGTVDGPPQLSSLSQPLARS